MRNIFIFQNCESNLIRLHKESWSRHFRECEADSSPQSGVGFKIEWHYSMFLHAVNSEKFTCTHQS